MQGTVFAIPVGKAIRHAKVRVNPKEMPNGRIR